MIQDVLSNFLSQVLFYPRRVRQSNSNFLFSLRTSPLPSIHGEKINHKTLHWIYGHCPLTARYIDSLLDRWIDRYLDSGPMMALGIGRNAIDNRYMRLDWQGNLKRNYLFSERKSSDKFLNGIINGCSLKKYPKFHKAIDYHSVQ